MLRYFSAILILLCSVAVFSSLAFAKPNNKYASIVMDADTGLILHESNPDKRLHPASLTKIMTLLMVFDAIEQNKMNLNTRVRISKHAASMVPSKLDLPAGASIKVKDAIYALVTKSANDIAVALGEHIAGSESNFAKLMTNRARKIGMRNTTFRNASGLHDERQITTARDMALLAQYVINAYPSYYRYFSRKSFTYQGKTYRNHNRLMDTYQGMDGMKTGYVAASGFNLVGSAVRNNRRIIGVVFGGRSSKSRNDHMAALLDKGFAKLNTMRVAHAQVPLPPRKPGFLVAMNAVKESFPTGEIIGEGDYDLERTRRVQTGMAAIAAHTGKEIDSVIAPLIARSQTARHSASTAKRDSTRVASLTPEEWSIQIGAFTSRAATDQMLKNGLRNLPQDYAGARPIIAPLKTSDGWLFRGRLTGFSKMGAYAACSYFKECMTVAPQNQ
ncbi:MAG: D-alanyl-D-alanine carboxypeptidase family protein [Bdellovibrionales bacterium]